MLLLSVKLSSSDKIKGGCWRSFRLQTLALLKKGDPTNSGQLFNTQLTPIGETLKKASFFTLLKQITRLKTANSKIRSTIDFPA